MMMPKLAELRKSAAAYLVQPAMRFLVFTRISPNALTWCGFALTVLAGVFILRGETLVGGIVVLVAGFFDMLDGALARQTSQVTRFGAVLDSTLDRVAEAVLMLCIMALYARAGSVLGVMLAGIALVGSLMVSYLRARIEAMGIACKEVGFFTRSERVVVLVLGLMLARLPFAVDVLLLALGVIAGFSLFTAGERLFFAWRQTRGQ